MAITLRDIAWQDSSTGKYPSKKHRLLKPRNVNPINLQTVGLTLAVMRMMATRTFENSFRNLWWTEWGNPTLESRGKRNREQGIRDGVAFSPETLTLKFAR